MQVEYLITFCSVVQEGGFSAAGRRLRLSQPAVSHQIDALEQSLGCRLIDRGRKPVVLSAAGQRIYPHLERCVDAYRQAEAVARRGLGDSGELRLSAIYTVGERLLPPVLAAFRDRYPHIVLSVTVGDRRSVARSVLEGSADLGLTFILPGDPGPPLPLRLAMLWEDPLHLVVARAHPWAQVADLRIEDLYDGVFIRRTEDLATRRIVERSLDPARLSTIMQTGSNEALRAAVKAGLGAGFVYASVLDDDLAVVPVDGLSMSRHLVAIIPRRPALSPWARALLDLLLGWPRPGTAAADRQAAGAPAELPDSPLPVPNPRP